ncbi:MAG: hypothetical protein IPO15_27360 [Anaerolineae bacterium]|uniref:hypothetical protein n=1 Tax=Candidatus Amarolinea dominans TaxID=3140696 RepID=UPI00313635E2|nr:hypothetical protein [Anaerolineae bacterium]
MLTADRSAIVLLDSAGVARFEAARAVRRACRAVAGHFPGRSMTLRPNPSWRLTCIKTPAWRRSALFCG